MKTIIADMDDISLDNPDANGLNWVYYLLGKYPRFKITLFAIPGRSTWHWLEDLSKIRGVELAVHGNMHDEDEVIDQDMIDGWHHPFKNIYKGPNWKVTGEERRLLENNGFRVISKPWLNKPDVVHGHCWIKADWERLESMIEPTTQFKFLSEVL